MNQRLKRSPNRRIKEGQD